MSQFFNQMVITCDRDDKMQFAGIEQKFKRPMMIHSAGAGDSIRIAPPVTMMFQSTVQKREKNAAYAQAKREGYAVCGEEVKAPIALCQFYRFQKKLTEKEPLVITVDTTRKATEVAELRTTKYMTSLEQAERIKFGTDELVEGMKRAICANMYARKASAYTLKMLEEQIEQSAKDSLYCFIHTRKSKAKVVLTSPGTNYKYQFSIRRQEYTDLLKESMEEVVAVVKSYIVHHPYWTRKKCKLILSGELYISEDAIHILEEELEEVDELYGYKLLHYKPKEAAVLGGTLICKKLLIDYGNYEIGGEICCASEKMGAIRNLNQTQREVYYKLLDVLLTGKEKFQMDDIEVLPYESINMLKKDFPQTELLLEYTTSSYTDKLFVTLHYKDKGRELLKEVECVADKILKECVREDLSDKEVFENIYNYICKHYRYQTEKDSEGNYPPYSYNITALLKSGVCKGYSLILVYLLGKNQIPVSYIVGNAGTSAFNGESLHAWNLLESTTGDVTHVDLTWDLGNTHVKKFQYHGDVAMQARTHFWQKSEYPACSI